MAIVEQVDTYDVTTEERGTAYTVSFDQDATFADRGVAEMAAAEINEVLKRYGG